MKHLTPEEEKEFDERFPCLYTNSQLCGVGECKTQVKDQVAIIKHNAVEKEMKKTVTLYMVALGDTKLPEKVWKRIAKVNQLLLDKYKK